MNFIDDMAAAEARHKRDGFDLQWCPTDEYGYLAKEYRENWRAAREDESPLSVAVVINRLMLCERPSGANAEANHAAFQKSRDRVAAELAQYDRVESIDDVRLRPITTREEADEVLGIDRED